MYSDSCYHWAPFKGEAQETVSPGSLAGVAELCPDSSNQAMQEPQLDVTALQLCGLGQVPLPLTSPFLTCLLLWFCGVEG